LPDQVAYLTGALRVEAVRRLVQNEQIARAQQRRGNAEALPHAERVVAVPLARGRGKPDAVERVDDPAARCPCRDTSVGGVEPGQVGVPRQVRVERRTFDQRANPGQHPRRVLDELLTEQSVRAGRWEDQPEQHTDRGGLPRAVRTQEAVDRAGRHP
jgi:hypothetical protein